MRVDTVDGGSEAKHLGIGHCVRWVALWGVHMDGLVQHSLLVAEQVEAKLRDGEEKKNKNSARQRNRPDREGATARI